MAKIVETVFVVRISQLVKNDFDLSEQTGFDDLSATLEEVVSKLVTSDSVVEVEKA